MVLKAMVTPARPDSMVALLEAPCGLGRKANQTPGVSCGICARCAQQVLRDLPFTVA